jgi:hypothetical protein
VASECRVWELRVGEEGHVGLMRGPTMPYFKKNHLKKKKIVVVVIFYFNYI